MNDQTGDLDFSEDLTEAEIAEGLRAASDELRGWINSGFERDLQRRAIAIARAKRDGEYRTKAEQEHLAHTFKPDADLGELQKANARLSELLGKGHLSKAEEAERLKLTRVVESNLKKYASPGSKTWRE